MEKEGINFLNQLMNSLEETAFKLGESYEKKDSSSFDKSKKLLLQIQKKILSLIK